MLVFFFRDLIFLFEYLVCFANIFFYFWNFFSYILICVIIIYYCHYYNKVKVLGIYDFLQLSTELVHRFGKSFKKKIKNSCAKFTTENILLFL